MNNPIIIDAGPSLNFFATNNERVLFRVVQRRLAAPETVQREVLDKSRSDRRFAPAHAVWKKLEGSWISVLSDDITPQLESAAQVVVGVPLAQRKRQAKDLGEVMVVTHAVAIAETGQNVQVIIDDGDGVALANAQRQRLDRLRRGGQPVGGLAVFNTHTILEQAAGAKEIPDKAAMRKIYEQLRGCDDGLIDIRQTRLLTPDVWNKPDRNSR